MRPLRGWPPIKGALADADKPVRESRLTGPCALKSGRSARISPNGGDDRRSTGSCFAIRAGSTVKQAVVRAPSGPEIDQAEGDRVVAYTNTRQAIATTKARVKPTIHFSSAWLPSSRVTAFLEVVLGGELVEVGASGRRAAARRGLRPACARCLRPRARAWRRGCRSSMRWMSVSCLGASCADCVSRGGSTPPSPPDRFVLGMPNLALTAC